MFLHVETVCLRFALFLFALSIPGLMLAQSASPAAQASAAQQEPSQAQQPSPPSKLPNAPAPAASSSSQQWIHADLDVQFAGQTAHYSQVPFKRTQEGNAVRITGTIPLTCSDFKIDRPTFLTVPIKNEIPVRVDMSWHSE
ncbi:MAG: hypothetical protein ACP5E2_05965 [Terracidiphilus sp.]